MEDEDIKDGKVRIAWTHRLWVLIHCEQERVKKEVKGYVPGGDYGDADEERQKLTADGKVWGILTATYTC